MHKLKHYLGKYESTLEEGSGRGHGYEVYVCTECGALSNAEPRNQFKIDFLYIISTPLKLGGQTLQDNFVDYMNERTMRGVFCDFWGFLPTFRTKPTKR